MEHSNETRSGDALSEVSRPLRLFSRDINYIRDVLLFWPLVMFSILAVYGAFHPEHRQLGFRCAIAAIASVLLAKERLALFLVATGFVAGQCALSLAVGRWRWTLFIVGLLTGIPSLLAYRYWRKPRLAYELPSEWRLVDFLLWLASLLIALLVGYVVSPYN